MKNEKFKIEDFLRNIELSTLNEIATPAPIELLISKHA